MGLGQQDDEEWDDLASLRWKGLGVTDPIKAVEVRAQRDRTALKGLTRGKGQMALITRVSQSQRAREAAQRLVQLLCRRRYQEHSQGKLKGHLRRRPTLLAQVHRRDRWIP